MGQALNLRRSPLVRRLARYASVSLISTATSLSVLGVLVGIVGMSAVWANLIAIAIGTVPSFELNRRWVWSFPGGHPRLAQVVPFCLLSFSGLVLSSAAVHVAAELTARDGRLLHTGAVEAGNLGSYGALWVIQFVLCDRVLFRRRPDALPVTPLGEAPGGTAVPTEESTLVLVGGSEPPSPRTSTGGTSQGGPSWIAPGGQHRPLY